ncbi:MAG: prepilin-type N-terminal cleavage/methylation domain-containing protein [Pirellula sp.]|jgi:prepilin-type N-terminal cleavage/methylation domain-containing protein
MRKDSSEIGFPPLGITRERIDSHRSIEALPIALRTQRRGVTLLELMVALGLLAMLLLVAWSLFDNLQKAEERSEGLANRVQVLRQIRTWLAEDLDQLVFPLNNPSDGKASSGDLYFVGDSTGFVATISPSLDPLPFLQDAFESPASKGDSPAMQEREDETELASVYDTDQDRQVRAARRSPWALEKISIDYTLEPQPMVLQNMATVSSEDFVYKLVRRERLPTTVSQSSSPERGSSLSGSNAPNNSVPAADRQLTIRDLYRQTDETRDTRGPALREKSLEGIQNAQFQYFDGTAWNSDWDSRKQNGFPVAVAVQFDFPSRSRARKDKAQRKMEANESDQAKVSSEQSFGSIDTLLSQQPTAQAETRDNQEYLIATSSAEMTIIVATHFRAPKPTHEESEQFSRDNTRSTKSNSSRRSP